MRTHSPRYHWFAVLLHWLMAALIVIGFRIGSTMVDMPISPKTLQWFSYHKWIGVTVFLLALVRVFWRARHAPPLALQAPVWQMRLAQCTHGALYVLLFLIPLSGWLYSSSAGYQTVYLGQFPIPDLLHKDKAVANALKQVHEALTTGLLFLVALHVLAAIKHQWIDKDGLLKRMWF